MRIKKYSSYLIYIAVYFTILKTKICNASVLSGDVLKEMIEHRSKFGDKSGIGAGTSPPTLAEIVATGISAFLSILAVVFVILIILAGYNWMTARGDEQKVTKAKDTIQRAIIGLIIIIAAYAITRFVFMRLPGGGGGADVTIN
jgi:hypothetical protein